MSEGGNDIYLSMLMYANNLSDYLSLLIRYPWFGQEGSER